MKKRFLTIAIAAGLAASFTANADAGVYGRVHLSIDKVESDNGTVSGDEFDMTDRKSAFGAKGSEDLGGGMKAFYKIEWSFDPADGGDIGTRDRYVGLKGGMGTVKFGTLTTSYKKTSAKIDPFWHTAAMGTNLGIASGLASGMGNARGRATNAMQYHSPKMGGMQMVLNVTLDNSRNNVTDSGDKNVGVGFRYQTKQLFAFVDYQKIDDTDSQGGSGSFGNAGEKATKVGATYKMGGTKVGFQHEMAEDLTNNDYTMLTVTQKLTDNDSILFTYGTAAHITTAGMDVDSFGLGYKHAMSKRTSLYAAYIDKDVDTESVANGSDQSGLTLGMRHTF